MAIILDIKSQQVVSSEICRLCHQPVQENSVNIYSDIGLLYDCEKKINKYLYLRVTRSDEYSKYLCVTCLMHLETFHKFWEKVNEIQKTFFREKYQSIVLDFSSPATQTVATQTDDDGKVEHVVEEDNTNSHIAEFTEPLDSLCPTTSVGEYFIEISADLKNTSTDVPNYLVKFVPEPELALVSQSTVQHHIECDSLPMKTRSKTNQDEIQQTINELVESVEHIKNESDEVLLTKRGRGRPKSKEESVRRKSSKLVKQEDVQSTDDIENEDESGDSENEFPARDSDNEEWPAKQTLDKFPRQIIEKGLLTVKGKKLMAMINKFYKLECDLCIGDKPRFRHLRELFSHYGEQHNETGYVVCCQTKFQRYPAVIMHMARHIQPEAFQCDICGYMVTRPRFLEAHRQTHLPDDQKPLACDQCPRRFCWKGALQIHQISHQPANQRKLYICHVCGKVYDTPGGLSTHKKLTHGEKKFESNVCHVCAKEFSTRTGLNEHMSTIHQPREKGQVQCSECGKWLMNNRCLKSHMILHSTVEHECSLCDYKTKKQMLLQRHLLTQHSTEKPFTCNLCGKSFKLKRALTVHLSHHNNSNKTYKCPFCDRVFASSTNFYTHRKNMHPVELSEMKKRELDEKRKRRIEAGIEVDSSSSDLLVGGGDATGSDDVALAMQSLQDLKDNDDDDDDDGLDVLMPSVRDIIDDANQLMQ